MAKNDGGPAFPTPSGHARIEVNYPGGDSGFQTVEVCKTGMSLRDWFAGKALEGLLSRPGQSANFVISGKQLTYDQAAYALADAMIAQREKSWNLKFKIRHSKFLEPQIEHGSNTEKETR